jgi:hypothetical protein
MPEYVIPGLYREEVQHAAPSRFCTGVPAFLGYVGNPFASEEIVAQNILKGSTADARQTAKLHHRRESQSTAEAPGTLRPCELTHWSQFAGQFGEPLDQGWLAYSVHGFFENGGKYCVVAPMRPGVAREEAMREALDSTRRFDNIDLVCAPDIFPPSPEKPDIEEVLRLQALLVQHAGNADRFAVLDSLPNADMAAEREHCARLYSNNLGLDSAAMASSALYYPWVIVAPLLSKTRRHSAGVGECTDALTAPPCGHIAGIYARTDSGGGIQKAPANERLEGVLDIEVHLSDAEQTVFFSSREPVKLASGEEVRIPRGAINCVRAFVGRGIRVWGARTLSHDVSWRYINVRRLFLAARRWIRHYMAHVTFEPITAALLSRVRRELTAYCLDLFQAGALKGRNRQEAFYVKCDEDLNPPEVRDRGMLVAEVGLAAAQPHEYIVVQLICRGGEVTIAAPSAADAI